MDKMCKKPEVEDLNKSFEAPEGTDKARCGSPVFKCVTQIKPVRESNLDSSDYDIPSYQVNQSLKSRTSSKFGNETSESVLPFSPVFSPIPVALAPQFQPPSVHSLGTVGKNIEKGTHNKVNSFSVHNKNEAFKPGGIFESLGMLDKDISWVSSMASPPPKKIPGSEFNTVEKATFLPEENFQSIQPRALFSPTFDDDFGCQPIEFTSGSDDDEAYKSNVRLSDVCATLKQLEVKSFDQALNNSVEKITPEEDCVISPVIKAKKRAENVKIKKKGALVISPQEKDKYEFSVGENSKVIDCDKVKPNDGSNFIEDDSFQSMSFSCIDELCKTLVTDQSDTFVTSKTSDCDKTLVNCVKTNFKPGEIPKKFYSSKVETLVHAVSSIDNLHSNAKALEEGNDYIPTGGKIDQSYADKGIVRFDVFSKEPSKLDGTKRLHSELSEEKDESIEKKFKKVDDENSGWENVKQYLSESQLNVSDGEMFKTVENLEKSLASQERKEAEKLSGKSTSDEGEVSSQKSISKASTKSSGNSQEQETNTNLNYNIDKLETHTTDMKNTFKGLFEMSFPAFTTASGVKISVSEKALNKAKEILKDCDENLEYIITKDCENKPEKLQVASEISFPAFTTASGTKISVSEKALNKAKEILKDCDENLEDTITKDCEKRSEKLQIISEMRFPAFTTASGTKISVSEKALNKAKEILKDCDENLEDIITSDCQKRPEKLEVASEISFPAFTTASGTKISVSEKALNKAKEILKDCDENLEDPITKDCQNRIDKFQVGSESSFVGFSTSSGKEIKISAEALEKAKAFLLRCEADDNDSLKTAEVGRNEVKDNLWEGVMESFPPTEKEKAVGKLPLVKSDEHVEGSEKVKTNIPKCDWLKGFTTGTGKLIKVSAQSLEKAKALMSECDEENIGGLSGTSMQNQIPNSMAVNDEEKFEVFSNGSGKAEKVVEKAKLLVEKCENEFKSCEELRAKEPPIVGFSTALGRKIEVSSEALEKAKALWDESALEKPENSIKPLGERSKEKKETTKGETTVEEEPDKPILESDDWEEIIPSWLHVYTTSPSMTSDRLELSPITDNGNSVKPYKEYIKSPVLGPSDRFHRKAKKRKLPEEKKSSDKNTDRASVKRTLNLDFSAPFKRIKVVDDSLNTDVKEERALAREEQEKTIKEKQRVKPLEGSHLRKKQSEKQMSWMEAVAKSSPEVHTNEILKSLGVNEDVLRVNIQNSMAFRFNGEHYFGSSVCSTNTKGIPAGDSCLLILDDENKLGVEEFKRSFLASPGVQPNLLPSGWVENHYKWIVWKLAHYERSFPLHFGGMCLTPNQVLLQLKYRYDREIDRNERSALKKILERDDSSVKRLVVCICGIKKVTVNEASGYELEVTDGWYSCPVRSDLAMSRLIEEGKLCIGTKLMTQGAVLVNCEQGVSPLELSGGVYLRISTNSTRRVRWDTKLGFQKNPENFPISLGSILAQGGTISRVDVIIVRIYPMLFMEKTDGHHVTRNRRTEEKADAEYRRIQEQQMEIIYNEIQTEMRRSGNFERDSDSKQLDDLCQLMEDPLTLQNLMLTNHRKLLEKLSSSDRFSRELVQKIEKKLENEKLKKRIVSQFLKVKIVDFRKPDYNNPAVLSVWNPDEDLTSVLAEGKVVSVMNLTINNSSRLYKPLQINTTRQTQFRPIAKNVKYPARKLTELKNVSSKVCPAFEEVDLVGMVALIQDVSYGSRLSQVVYLTDLEMNFVGVVFWGSCKDFGWENVLRMKSVVACSNVQWKKNYTQQDVPSVYANENSVFTENPKQGYLKEEIERLKQNIPQQDITEFLSKCEEDITSKVEDSKWRTNTSKNSSNDSINTPKGDNGFESKPTASSTPIKPFTFRSNSSSDAEPSPIQKRIEKLQAYGEPSSLIPLLIRNNMKRKFKTRPKSLNNQSTG